MIKNKLSQSMYKYKLRVEHMTRVRCKFFLLSEKMDKLSKKRRVECLRTRVLGLVVVVNSRVGWEAREGK